MTIDCTIMSGAGNIFTVIDNRRAQLSVENGGRLAPVLCSAAVAGRTTEGLMLIGAPERDGADFHMDFFNPDGSHGAMCGNGGRCAVRFAVDAGIAVPRANALLVFTVLDTVYTARLDGDMVRLDFPPPRRVVLPCTVHLDGLPLTGAFVDVGSDHFVLPFSELAPLCGGGFETFDIGLWGARLRSHPDFAPRGANANVYTLLPDGTVRLRTFERGVEAETGACGTGAVSTALVAALRHGLPSPVRIVPTSGSPLAVYIGTPAGTTSALALEGTAIVIEQRTATLPA